jgi:hypothetical protein
MFTYKKMTVRELLHAQMSMPIAQAYFHGNLCTGQNRPLIGYFLKDLRSHFYEVSLNEVSLNIIVGIISPPDFKTKAQIILLLFNFKFFLTLFHLPPLSFHCVGDSLNVLLRSVD